MANLLDDIRKGVYSKLTSASSSFRTAITVSAAYQLYYFEAPQGKALPYVVFTILPVTESRDSTTKFPAFELQFSIAASTDLTAQNIAGYLRDLFDDCESSLTIGVYKSIDVSFKTLVSLGKIDNVYNIAVTYQITLQH